MWTQAVVATKEVDALRTTGCVVTILGAAVHWVSIVQKDVTLSGNEVEYVAMCRATQGFFSEGASKHAERGAAPADYSL